VRVALATAKHKIAGGTVTMRAEIEAIIAEIKRSVGLLRRHL
jgi:hypothetical protein